MCPLRRPLPLPFRRTLRVPMTKTTTMSYTTTTYRRVTSRPPSIGPRRRRRRAHIIIFNTYYNRAAFFLLCYYGFVIIVGLLLPVSSSCCHPSPLIRRDRRRYRHGTLPKKKNRFGSFIENNFCSSDTLHRVIFITRGHAHTCQFRGVYSDKSHVFFRRREIQ